MRSLYHISYIDIETEIFNKELKDSKAYSLCTLLFFAFTFPNWLPSADLMSPSKPTLPQLGLLDYQVCLFSQPTGAKLLSRVLCSSVKQHPFYTEICFTHDVHVGNGRISQDWENSLQLSTFKFFLALRSWCLSARERGPELSEFSAKKCGKVSAKNKLSFGTDFWPKWSALRANSIIMTSRCGYSSSQK